MPDEKPLTPEERSAKVKRAHQTISNLCNQRDQLCRELADLKIWTAPDGTTIDLTDNAVVLQMHAAVCQLAEARADTERLDWILTHPDVQVTIWGVDEIGFNPKGKHLLTRADIDAAHLAQKPVQRLWSFERYRDGQLKVEGANVHADTLEEALEKARRLFPEDRGKSEFRLAQKPEEE